MVSRGVGWHGFPGECLVLRGFGQSGPRTLLQLRGQIEIPEFLFDEKSTLF